MFVNIIPYQELKADFTAKNAHLSKPTGINQLYLADFTGLRIPGYRASCILLVMDHFSRYLLTLKVFPSKSADAFINGLENALEEAMKISDLDLKQIITLVTGTRRPMTAKKTAEYIENSPYFHILGRTRQPYTRGMMERLIWTVELEGIYDNIYSNPLDAQKKLEKFRLEYNLIRPHQALKYKTPYEIYTGKKFHRSDHYDF